MKIIQKKYPDKATFNFLENEVICTNKDSLKEQTIRIKYSELPDIEDVQEVKLTNKINIYLGSALLIVASVQVFFLKIVHHINLLWATVGLIALITCFWQKNKYSVIVSDKGHIFILSDKQHDKIIDLLKEKRKEYYLSLYGQIDENSTAEEELIKFKWLYDQGFLSIDEYEEIIAKINRILFDDESLDGPSIQ